jgi:predicted alpha-1,2-mannosidase
MRKFLLQVTVLLHLAIPIIGYSQTVQKKNLVDYANPLVGTDSDVALSNGNTYPAIALPWGMNFWTPVTNKDLKSGWTYNYDDYKICGFKQTHQPSPWVNDYGTFALMPLTGKLKITPEERLSWFSHKAEVAKPHYYKVYLADYDLTTEITPTERAAQFRITYPQSDESYMLIDGYGKGNYIKIIPEEKKIIGYTKYATGSVPENFKTYFVLYFDKPFEAGFTWKDGEIQKDKAENSGSHLIGIIKFKTKTDEVVNVKVASSFISQEQAELNLKREIDNDTFDQTKQKAAAAWNKEFNRFEIEGGTVKQLSTFYTALYRALLFPRKFFEYDKDNTLVHYSPYNGKVLPGYMFTDNGFWDTFRGVFPFFTFMYPELNSQIMAGLVNAYKEGGWLPEWASPGYHNVMIGSNSASLIADSYMKGIRGYDIETLFEAVLKNAENEGPMTSVGRFGVKHYNTLGYIPYDAGVHENVARALEYSYADFCIWQLAKALNKPQHVIDTFAKRALYYRNVFDPSTNFMRGKNKDGTFQSPFRPDKWGDAFTEGCSWHYTWSVFQDLKGLMSLMGGKQKFVEKLDSVFSSPPTFDYSYYGGQIHEITEMLIADMGQYAHGNQPIQHMIYLYNYAGEPWKTQKWVREVMDRLYSPDPDGLCGDEDNGQTSAWYVFSAMGMYSVTPGASQYVIGSPLFNKMTLHLENGKTLTIEAKGNSSENVYIKSATLNGKEYTKNYFDHDVLMKGGEIVYEMSSKPNQTRGVTPEDFPYSMTEKEFVSPPYAKSAETYFTKAGTVALACKVKDAQIRYTLDGSEPTAGSKLYAKPIVLTKTTMLKAKAFANGKEPSPVITMQFEKAELQKSLKVAGIVPGLKYEYFKGSVNSVEKLQNPITIGKAKTVDLSMKEQDDNFGLIFTGFIEIPIDGLYTFYLTSDDGSKLSINDKVVVGNDGFHGSVTASGKVGLAKGLHKIEVRFFEGAVAEQLDFEWEGPGIKRQIVPEKVYFVDSKAIANLKTSSAEVPAKKAEPNTETFKEGAYVLNFIVKDTTFNVETKKKMISTFFKVYPKLAESFNPKTRSEITFIIDPDYDGVAAAWDGKVVFSPEWMRKKPNDIDVVTHEVMHIVQSYPQGAGPGWLTEGIADYVRYKFGLDNKGAGWSLPEFSKDHSYTKSYRITARFLAWVENQHPGVVQKLDSSLRDRLYSSDSWKEITGKTIDELWERYAENPQLVSK